MKIIFDLDYCLLDTAKFEEALTEIFKDFDFKKNYKNFKEKGKNFDIGAFIDFLNENYEMTAAQIREIEVKCDELLKRVDEFLFPEAEKLLELLKRNGYEIILATFGRKIWQEQKVNGLSETVKEKFDSIIFNESDKSKSEFLKKLAENQEKIIIVNDNADESMEMKKALAGRAEIYLLDSKYSGNAEHNFKIYSLGELYQYFAKLFEQSQELKNNFK